MLRRWALELLGTTAGPAESAWQRARACAPESWELFLVKERCAFPLQQRLRQTGALGRLPDRTAAVLRTRALYELKRVLSARSHLAMIARLAQERGWKVMVLKGGVAVAAGEELYLADVDILVEPEQAEELARALGDNGFGATGPDRSTSHHLAARLQPHSLPIEIHRFISGIADIDAIRARAVPLEQQLPLWRPCPADHLRYLLVHITNQHPDRAGRIRDLLVIGHALGDCSPADLATVERDLAQHEHAATVREVLRSARSLQSGDWHDDLFERHALCGYIMATRPVRNGLQQHLYTRAVFLAIARRPWWREFLEYRARASTIDFYRPIAWLRRHLPPLATAVQSALHLSLFLTASALAGTLNREARRIEGVLGSARGQ